MVTAVEPDSGAEKAGVMRGDVIREINRQPVKSVKDFEKVSSRLKKGENVLILIDRRGNALFLSAKSDDHNNEDGAVGCCPICMP